MSNKNGESNGSGGGFWSNPITTGMAMVGLAFILGSRQIRKGYELGTEVSNRVLKRHDKDVKLIEKRIRREKKEALKEQRRQERLREKATEP